MKSLHDWTILYVKTQIKIYTPVFSESSCTGSQDFNDLGLLQTLVMKVDQFANKYFHKIQIILKFSSIQFFLYLHFVFMQKKRVQQRRLLLTVHKLINALSK